MSPPAACLRSSSNKSTLSLTTVVLPHVLQTFMRMARWSSTSTLLLHHVRGLYSIEVLRPKRRARRGRKSDPADAEAAARAVLSGQATACPKSADGPVEAIQMLRAARRSAVKARTRAINQIKGLLVTAPEQVAAPPAGPSQCCAGRACPRLRPDPGRGEATPTGSIAFSISRRSRPT